mmetsp:Transcript_47748/g.126415  ORF Transcript_47748/g.126415 Transcript_47748/m.126415 type:complete len:215 (-) Transcript_47748:94-738(-)
MNLLQREVNRQLLTLVHGATSVVPKLRVDAETASRNLDTTLPRFKHPTYIETRKPREREWKSCGELDRTLSTRTNVSVASAFSSEVVEGSTPISTEMKVMMTVSDKRNAGITSIPPHRGLKGRRFRRAVEQQMLAHRQLHAPRVEISPRNSRGSRVALPEVISEGSHESYSTPRVHLEVAEHDLPSRVDDIDVGVACPDRRDSASLIASTEFSI